MSLYVKDPAVAQLARELAERRKTSKTEAVRQALQHELERDRNDDLVERAVAFARRARALSHPEKGLPADKAFRDSLYED